MPEHLVHGILIEQPFVDRLGLDALWNVALVTPFERIPSVLVFLGEIVVLDTFALEFQRD